MFLRQYRDPAQALEELNNQMAAPDRPEEFISLVVVLFDTDANTLRFASAGRPAAWLWHDKEVRPLRATGPLLMLDPNGGFYSREIGLNQGDLLLLYTDGLAEVRNGEQIFGEERIAAPLRRDPGVAAGVLCKNLLETARDFASEPMGDDVAILAIRHTLTWAPTTPIAGAGPEVPLPGPYAHQRRSFARHRAGAGGQPRQGGRQAGGAAQAVRARPPGAAARRRLVRRGRAAGQQPGRRPAR